MLTRLKAQLFLQTLRDAERLAPQQMFQYAADLLHRLIGQTVSSPFWHERLAMLAGNDGTVSLDRWQEVPPLTAAEADRAGADMLAVRTGSEGEITDAGASAGPFRWRDKLAFLADLCVFERVLELHQVPLDARLIDIPDSPFPFAEDWSWNTTFDKAPHGEIPSAWPPETQLQAIRTQPQSILRAAPAALKSLVDFIAESSEDFPKLAAVVSIGVPIEDSLCSRLLEHLAQSVVAIWYDPRLGILAYGDPTGIGWRIANATQFVEMIDAEGRRCPPSDVGRIAVTPLYNYWTPAVRFMPGYQARSAVAKDGRQMLTGLTCQGP
jgi:hypothetical protein